MYVQFPLSLRNVEDLLHERGIDICHETARFSKSAVFPLAWHLDEAFVRINGKMRYLWRAVDHEGEVLEVATTRSVACRSSF